MYKFYLESKGNEDIGFLVSLEKSTKIPFDIKRIFYIHGVPSDGERGAHAYYNTKQVFICLSGSLKVRCFDGVNEYIHELNKCYEALYIPSKIWRSTFEHFSDTVLLVISSLEYNEDDYIRDYNKFLEVIVCM
jgi:hypothetical protein